jgi:hypothetical protein
MQQIKISQNLTTIVTEGELIFTEHNLDTKEDEKEMAKLRISTLFKGPQDV